MGKRSDSPPPCPYCAAPQLFEPRNEREGVRDFMAGPQLSGKFWERGPAGPRRNVRSFPVFRFGEREWRFKIKGAENFTKPYQGFDVEVIGLEFPFRPMQSAGPGFYQSIQYTPGPRESREVTKVRSYNACRITHRATSVIADAHAWGTHGLLVTVKNLPSNPTGPAIKAASTLLVFFAREYRGAPKITRDYIMDAFEKLGAEAPQAAVARELRVTERALQMWAEREGIEGWSEMREQFAPRPQTTGAK